MPIHKPWVYQIYINSQKKLIDKVQRYTPVIVGEWCISNDYATNVGKGQTMTEELCEIKRNRFREIAKLQLDAWSASAGHIYWNYQLLRDRETPMDEEWKESWDIYRCWLRGWVPEKL